MDPIPWWGWLLIACLWWAWGPPVLVLFAGLCVAASWVARQVWVIPWAALKALAAPRRRR